MAATTFGTWLAQELERQGVSRRELARRLAEKHPEGVNEKTIGSSRRGVYKYLDTEKPANPTKPTRRAFAEALGVDPGQIPDDEDEEEDLQLALLIRACRAKSRTGRELPWRLEQWLRMGIRNGIFAEFAEDEMAAATGVTTSIGGRDQ